MGLWGFNVLYSMRLRGKKAVEERGKYDMTTEYLYIEKNLFFYC